MGIWFTSVAHLAHDSDMAIIGHIWLTDLLLLLDLRNQIRKRCRWWPAHDLCCAIYCCAIYCCAPAICAKTIGAKTIGAKTICAMTVCAMTICKLTFRDMIVAS